MNLNNLPEELKDLHQWVIWRADKHPRNSTTGDNASTDDPSSWSSYDVAATAVKKKRAKGVGFVFSEDDPYVGIDLDKVIKNGKIDPAAQKIIDEIDSYTEISQSGTGIHIIARAKKPTSKCRKGDVEIYDKSRYFALTGDLWEDRGDLNDRQEKVEWLCSDIFGDEEGAAANYDCDIEIDPDAKPPSDKLKGILRKKTFRDLWNYSEGDLLSMSDYDWRLVNIAAEAEWTDQDLANLIIAFRRKNGDDKDIEKSLRGDYLSMTISKVRAAVPQDKTGLLPFTVKEIIQLGMQDAEFEMITVEYGRIPMGNTEAFLSPTKARARLFEAGVPILGLDMTKKWHPIVKQLMPLIVKRHSVTREENTKAWLDDYLGGRGDMPRAEKKGDIEDIFSDVQNSSAQDNQGRLFLRLSDLTRYVKIHIGGGSSARTIANDLINLQFHKEKIMVQTANQTQKPIFIWISPIGFMNPQRR